jgi:tRNA modification GTPase
VRRVLDLDPSDTIAAIASASGPAARGIVRLSGSRAWEIAREGFESEAAKCGPPCVLSGHLRLEGLHGPLPANLLLARAPRSYTGEDLAEIHTVGAAPILQQALGCCLARGARLAQPGEFTLRAFLNGRLDLTQAEAVLGVIESRSRSQLDVALAQLAGGLARPIHILRDRLLDLLAHLEAGLDFVDEADVDPIGRAALAAELGAAAAEVSRLAGGLRDRDRPAGLPVVVLVGPPNAGKSALFNALVGHPRALVAPQAGTTRDHLTATCHMGAIEVTLVDTAGSQPAADAIAAAAQEQTRVASAGADLLLVCAPGETGASEPEASPRALRVATKCDTPGHRFAPGHLPTSAHTGHGIDALRGAIAGLLGRGTTDADPIAASSARCAAALREAAASLVRAREAMELQAGDELVAIELHLALDALGHVVGATCTDDVLDRIFRRFCIGK